MALGCEFKHPVRQPSEPLSILAYEIEIFGRWAKADMPSAILSELARDICTCCSVIQHLWGKHWIAPLRGRLQPVPRGSGPETSVGG